jgi:hypothetical protein
MTRSIGKKLLDRRPSMRAALLSIFCSVHPGDLRGV